MYDGKYKHSEKLYKVIWGEQWEASQQYYSGIIENAPWYMIALSKNKIGYEASLEFLRKDDE